MTFLRRAPRDPPKQPQPARGGHGLFGRHSTMVGDSVLYVAWSRKWQQGSDVRLLDIRLDIHIL